MPTVKAGVQAPDFTLPDLTGRPQTLSALLASGDVLIAFFKVSCPTCQYTFPFLERLHKQSEARRLRVYGISQDDRQKSAKFAQQFGVSFPILLDSEEEDYTVSNAYGITHVPSLFLIDSGGRIVLTSVGFCKADLEEMAQRGGTLPLFHRDEKIEAFRAG
jgi:peroxiredoxin